MCSDKSPSRRSTDAHGDTSPPYFQSIHCARSADRTVCMDRTRENRGSSTAVESFHESPRSSHPRTGADSRRCRIPAHRLPLYRMNRQSRIRGLLTAIRLPARNDHLVQIFQSTRREQASIPRSMHASKRNVAATNGDGLTVPYKTVLPESLDEVQLSRAMRDVPFMLPDVCRRYGTVGYPQRPAPINNHRKAAQPE